MPRGIPGSGKAALKKQATQQAAPTQETAPAKKTWSRRPKAAISTGPVPENLKQGGERNYSLVEKFSCAQAYLSTLIALHNSYSNPSFVGSPVADAIEREIFATLDTLSRLRVDTFGQNQGPTPTLKAPEITADRRVEDQQIRQHLPPPTHVGPPAPQRIEQGQQAPFAPVPGPTA